MADEYAQDDAQTQPEELDNPVIRKAISGAYAAFFDAIEGHDLGDDELSFAIADTVARIARDVYVNIEASGNERIPEPEEFALNTMLDIGARLEDLLDIELDVEDDDEVNEDMLPVSATQH